MLSKLSLATLALAVTLVPAYAQHGHGGAGAQHGGGAVMPPPAPEAVNVPSAGATLPMREIGGRVVVQVKINGQGPYPFVLGTAANLTVIDSALNNKLQLPVAEGMQAAPSGGNTPVIVQLQELHVGDAVVRGFIGAVMPLGNLLGTEPGAPRGIVSAALFQGYLITYDYPKKRVSIAKGKLDSADKLSIFEYSESRPMLPVRVGGRETRVGLDTGSPHGLTLPARLMSEVQLATPAQRNGMRRTTSGEFPVSTATLTSPIEIGQFKLAAKEVSFSDARAGSGPATGSLGNEVLRNFVVTLDIWNHRIRLTQ